VFAIIPGVEAGAASHTQEYANRLIRLQTPRWKRWLGFQRLHAWNLQRLDPGLTLDLGCGIGRNLIHVRGVGVDVNEHCVRAARARGLDAFTPTEFNASEHDRPGRFDSLLVAHVVEHMTEDQAVALVREYEPLVRPGGQLLLMAPQEAGFASDATHVQFMDFARLSRIAERAGFAPARTLSFPLPRLAGRWFRYNEFVLVSRKPPSDRSPR
jgi:2-polyprenyl-3-methyl-5-hydroxy-6-metoxy-1,4-benzoquinol methylase